MRAFGFLSFGHYGNSYGSQALTASDMIKQAVEICATRRRTERRLIVSLCSIVSM